MRTENMVSLERKICYANVKVTQSISYKWILCILVFDSGEHGGLLFENDEVTCIIYYESRGWQSVW